MNLQIRHRHGCKEKKIGDSEYQPRIIMLRTNYIMNETIRTQQNSKRILRENRTETVNIKRR